MSNDGALRKFVFGGTAGCMATLVVQPLDLVKTRLQLSPVKSTPLAMLTSTLRAEGPMALYNGLSAALFRQITYTTARMGVFQWLIALYDEKRLSFAHRVLFGAVAGGLAGVVGNPAEVVLVRMTADGRLPPEQRRNYRHVGHALGTIVRTEGVATLARGTSATVSRAMVLNAAQLGTYSQAKSFMLKLGLFTHPDSVWLHTAGGMVSGLACTIVSLPIDMAKSRLQQMRVDASGAMPYRGTLDVMRKVAIADGPLALWRGFFPYFFRLGPHTVLAFIFLEQLNKRFGTVKSSM